MKTKNLIFVGCCAVLCSSMTSIALAAESKKGIPDATPPGFVGPEVGDEMSVQEVLAIAKDGLKVTLKGHIIKRLSHDKYIFTDNTAEIVLEIHNKAMPPEQITPETLVKIYGKLDKDYFPSKIEIEVKRIEVQK